MKATPCFSDDPFGLLWTKWGNTERNSQTKGFSLYFGSIILCATARPFPHPSPQMDLCSQHILNTILWSAHSNSLPKFHFVFGDCFFWGGELVVVVFLLKWMLNVSVSDKLSINASTMCKATAGLPRARNKGRRETDAHKKWCFFKIASTKEQ